MKTALTTLLLILLAAPVFGQDSSPCPIEGEKIHWIADFCMAKLETDDEIAAMDCINQELEHPFPNDCTAKRHYKRALCTLAIADKVIAETPERCLEDKDFMGSTVRNKGVGN